MKIIAMNRGTARSLQDWAREEPKPKKKAALDEHITLRLGSSLEAFAKGTHESKKGKKGKKAKP